jgi:hypothetical protein
MKKHIPLNTAPFIPYTPHKSILHTERTPIPIKQPSNPSSHHKHVHFLNNTSTPPTSISSPSNTISTTATHHYKPKRLLNPTTPINNNHSLKITTTTTATTPRSKSKKQKKTKEHLSQSNRNRYLLNRYVYKYDINTSNEIELFRKRKRNYELNYYQFKMIDLLRKNNFEKDSITHLSKTFTKIRNQAIIPLSNYDTISNVNYIQQMERKERAVVNNINKKNDKLLIYITNTNKQEHKIPCHYIRLPKIHVIKTIK